MTRYLSEELSEKLLACVTDDGIILTKKLQQSLSYEEQWSLVMAYMTKVRRQKLRHDTARAISEVKAAVARNDLPSAAESLKDVYLSVDSNILEMTQEEAQQRSVELMAIKEGVTKAIDRLNLAIQAMYRADMLPSQKLVDVYSMKEIADLVASME